MSMAALTDITREEVAQVHKSIIHMTNNRLNFYYLVQTLDMAFPSPAVGFTLM